MQHFLKISEKCCKIAISVKNEARMKLVCMYQLPQTPPPPSTSNFIPEFPRKAKLDALGLAVDAPADKAHVGGHLPAAGQG